MSSVRCARSGAADSYQRTPHRSRRCRSCRFLPQRSRGPADFRGRPAPTTRTRDARSFACPHPHFAQHDMAGRNAQAVIAQRHDRRLLEVALDSSNALICVIKPEQDHSRQDNPSPSDPSPAPEAEFIARICVPLPQGRGNRSLASSVRKSARRLPSPRPPS